MTMIWRINLPAAPPHAGIIYFRLPLASSVNEKIAWLQLILTEQQAALGKLLVVTPSGLRVS